MEQKGISKACTQPAWRYAEWPLANGDLAVSPAASEKREGLGRTPGAPVVRPSHCGAAAAAAGLGGARSRGQEVRRPYTCEQAKYGGVQVYITPACPSHQDNQLLLLWQQEQLAGAVAPAGPHAHLQEVNSSRQFKTAVAGEFNLTTRSPVSIAVPAAALHGWQDQGETGRFRTGLRRYDAAAWERGAH